MFGQVVKVWTYIGTGSSQNILWYFFVRIRVYASHAQREGNKSHVEKRRLSQGPGEQKRGTRGFVPRQPAAQKIVAAAPLSRSALSATSTSTHWQELYKHAHAHARVLTTGVHRSPTVEAKSSKPATCTPFKGAGWVANTVMEGEGVSNKEKNGRR